MTGIGVVGAPVVVAGGSDVDGPGVVGGGEFVGAAELVGSGVRGGVVSGGA